MADKEAEASLSEAVGRLMQSDLRVVQADYDLLRRMNEAASAKYAELGGVTKVLSRHVEDIRSKDASFRPYLERVDEICDAVAQIEQTVMLLDDYTIRLVRLLIFCLFFCLCFYASFCSGGEVCCEFAQKVLSIRKAVVKEVFFSFFFLIYSGLTNLISMSLVMTPTSSPWLVT